MHLFPLVVISFLFTFSNVQTASARAFLDHRGIEMGPANISITAANTFESDVGSRLLTLWRVWPDLQLWAIHIQSPRGPAMRVTDFTSIKIIAYSPEENEVVETENGEQTPGGWTTPEAHSTSERRIPTWHWEKSRKSLSAAFTIFRSQVQAPVTRIIMIEFRSGLPWRPLHQQFYVFYLDNDLSHCWYVGATDGVLYPPRTFPTSPDMSSTWIGNGSNTLTS